MRYRPGRRGDGGRLVENKGDGVAAQGKAVARAAKESNGTGFERTFRAIDDVLWKEAGCATELDYTEQTSWMLFLKYLDDLEFERAQETCDFLGEKRSDTFDTDATICVVVSFESF